MNRIQLGASATSADAHAASVQHARLAQSTSPGVRHATWVPMHYEPNYAYPLLIWLHGPRDSERQLQKVMPLISMRNYIAVAPFCADLAKEGGSLSPNDPGLISESAISRCEQAVFECLEAARSRFHVNPDRVFLAGLQASGTMAFRVGLRQPAAFAGLLSLLGPFPRGRTPLLHLDEVRRVPLFIAHGRDAQSYTVDTTCDELRLFHAAGLNVTLRQYPCGDELTTLMLRDMDNWIMQLVTGQAK